MPVIRDYPSHDAEVKKFTKNTFASFLSFTGANIIL